MAAAGAITAEFEAMKDCLTELRLSAKTNLLSLSGELLAARLISDDNEESAGNRNVDEAARATDLVRLVKDKVREDPCNFHKFLAILKNDYQQYKSVINKLKNRYDMHKRAASQLRGVSSTTFDSDENGNATICLLLG